MFTAVLDQPGGPAVEVTPIAESCQWDTAAVGGYGSCSFTVPGLVRGVYRHLTVVRLYYGTVQLWEGRIEDVGYTVADGQLQTQLQAFGWRRLLDFTSVRRMWSKRQVNWNQITSISGKSLRPDQWAVATGQVDPSDLTKQGVRVRGTGAGGTSGSTSANGAEYILPSGLTLQKVLADLWIFGTSEISGFIQYTTDGSTWTNSDIANPTQGAAYAQSISVSGATTVRVGLVVNASGTTTDTGKYADWINIRLLGTSISEDAAGGFYGDTILKDLISLIPGLGAGTIESGSDFLIQALDYSTRTTSTDIVTQIASCYSREWAVWEAGRFDWKTPNLDEAQYIISIADTTTVEVTSSVDTLVKSSYILYTDAATGLDAEQSATSASPRNPFVRTGAAKDDLQQPGVPMTSNTAAQLASVYATAYGDYPPVTGRVVLPAKRLVSHAEGQQVPAFQIRAGANIYIHDLPRDQAFNNGRDGQTLFHIVTAETDMVQNTVTLELEGQGRQMDVILARLAAATRVLTG